MRDLLFGNKCDIGFRWTVMTFVECSDLSQECCGLVASYESEMKPVIISRVSFFILIMDRVLYFSAVDSETASIFVLAIRSSVTVNPAFRPLFILDFWKWKVLYHHFLTLIRYHLHVSFLFFKLRFRFDSDHR